MASGKRQWKNERSRGKAPTRTFASSARDRRPEEPYMLFLERMCRKNMLLSPKALVLDLGCLKDASNDEICNAFQRQYRVAKHKGEKKWINELRQEARNICHESWIDQHLISLNGQKLTSHRKVNVDIKDPLDSGMCRDIRLQSDPTIPVLQENAADSEPQYPVAVVAEERTAVATAGPTLSLLSTHDENTLDLTQAPTETETSHMDQQMRKDDTLDLTPTPTETDTIDMDKQETRNLDITPDLAIQPPNLTTQQPNRKIQPPNWTFENMDDDPSTSTGRLASMAFVASSRKRRLPDASEGTRLKTQRPKMSPVCLPEPPRRVDVDAEDQGQITVKVDAAQSSSNRPVCLFPACGSVDKRLRRHIHQRHVPPLFNDKSIDVLSLQRKYEALMSLIRASVGENASLEGAMAAVTNSQDLHPISEIHQDHTIEMKALYQFQKWEEPETFNMHPVNSPVVLLHWRCQLALLLRLPIERRNQYSPDQSKV